jgi:hypothetical protein
MVWTLDKYNEARNQPDQPANGDPTEERYIYWFLSSSVVLMFPPRILALIILPKTSYTNNPCYYTDAYSNSIVSSSFFCLHFFQQ